MLPTEESEALLDLTEQLADAELAPCVNDFEARGEFPREVIRTLGRSGLLSLPYPVEYGGGGQPYEVYLQVLELLAQRWSPWPRRSPSTRWPATRWRPMAATRSASVSCRTCSAASCSV